MGARTSLHERATLYHPARDGRQTSHQVPRCRCAGPLDVLLHDVAPPIPLARARRSSASSRCPRSVEGPVIKHGRRGRSHLCCICSASSRLATICGACTMAMCISGSSEALSGCPRSRSSARACPYLRSRTVQPVIPARTPDPSRDDLDPTLGSPSSARPSISSHAQRPIRSTTPLQCHDRAIRAVRLLVQIDLGSERLQLSRQGAASSWASSARVSAPPCVQAPCCSSVELSMPCRGLACVSASPASSIPALPKGPQRGSRQILAQPPTREGWQSHPLGPWGKQFWRPGSPAVCIIRNSPGAAAIHV